MQKGKSFSVLKQTVLAAIGI